MYLSAVAVSEFQVKQAVTDLPLRMQAGLLMRGVRREAGDDRSVVKDDVKLIAQAICESITHVLTEDARTLARYLDQLRAAGECAVQAILLKDGFDTAWFNNGQRGLPGT